MGTGALGQPALDVLKHGLLLELVEDFVVETWIQAEGSLRHRRAGEESLAADWVDDLVVAALEQEKWDAQLAGTGDELFAAGNGVPVEPTGDAIVDQWIVRVPAGHLRVMAQQCRVDLVGDGEPRCDPWQDFRQRTLPGR